MTDKTTTTGAVGPSQEIWLQALESGQYPQVDGWLCLNGGYCCLGVACKIFGLPSKVRETSAGDKALSFSGEEDIAPPEIVNRLGLYSPTGHPAPDKDGKQPDIQSLASLNDGGLFSFQEIAALIRQNPSMYFSEPR
jgi:hypothetical protein